MSKSGPKIKDISKPRLVAALMTELGAARAIVVARLGASDVVLPRR